MGIAKWSKLRNQSLNMIGISNITLFTKEKFHDAYLYGCKNADICPQMSCILAIESSCDETAAAVIRDGKLRSNVVSTQLDHGKYGGVIPELASRLHMQNVIKVVMEALEQAQAPKEELNAIAFTQGPGLMGALMVGALFAKGFALGLGIPLISVNHMQAHVLANFLTDSPPEFPFLCLTVSGGHTQLIIVQDHLKMELIGQSIDDAAGEAFDKAGKIMGLPYPAGPQIDKLAENGDINFHSFPKPSIPGYNFSFSGLKTSLLYFLRAGVKENPDFVTQNLPDICASYQHRIVSYLLDRTEKAAKEHKVKHLAIAGGVSANSYLRRHFVELCNQNGWKSYIPDFEYCTDNAAMIAMAAHFKYLKKDFAKHDSVPFAREKL